MAVTYPVVTLDQLKGPYQGAPVATPMHLARILVNVTGTYATGGLGVDVSLAYAATAALPTGVGSRGGVTAINVLFARAYGDYYDGVLSADVDNGSIALSTGGVLSSISAASTNNLVLVKLFSGVNGTGGAEIAAATVVSGWFGLVIGVQLTYGSLGVL